MYFCGAVCGDGGTEMEMCRIQAGASVWRKAEVVIGYRHIYRKVKRMVLSSCVTPACLYSLKTMAMTEKTVRETASLREYLGEKNCRSEKDRQAKN